MTEYNEFDLTDVHHRNKNTKSNFFSNLQWKSHQGNCEYDGKPCKIVNTETLRSAEFKTQKACYENYKISKEDFSGLYLNKDMLFRKKYRFVSIQPL